MLTETLVTKSREKRTTESFAKNSQKAFREFPSFPFPLRAALDRGEPSERKLDGNIPPLILTTTCRTESPRKQKYN